MTSEDFAHGLMFHHFHQDEDEEGQGSISGEVFEEIILRYQGRILSAEDWIERSKAGTLKADDVCVTFDDALSCQYRVAAPVLEKLGITAFWFVYTSPYEGKKELLEIFREFRNRAFKTMAQFYLAFEEAVDAGPFHLEKQQKIGGYDHENWSSYPFYTEGDTRFRFIRDEILGPEKYDEVMMAVIDSSDFTIERLAEGLWIAPGDLQHLASTGHEIGLHTHTHPTTLAKLPEEQQREEFEKNYAAITSITGRAPQSVSYPCNSYNENTIQIVRDLGIELGFRANMRLTERSHLEYPREDHANLL